MSGKKCHAKRRYHDTQQAREALRRIMRNSRRQVVPTRIYFCPVCRGYHLTSQARKT